MIGSPLHTVWINIYTSFVTASTFTYVFVLEGLLRFMEGILLLLICYDLEYLLCPSVSLFYLFRKFISKYYLIPACKGFVYRIHSSSNIV